MSTIQDVLTRPAQQYFEIRSRNILKLRETKKPNPYPHKFHETYDPRNLVKDYGHLKSGEDKEETNIQVIGRILNKRSSGTKLVFYDVRAEDVKLQVMCQTNLSKSSTGVSFEDQHEHLRRGDIIGIVGYPGRTAPKNRIENGEEGELSIFATEIILLTPCLQQVPDDYYGFKDSEQVGYQFIKKRASRTFCLSYSDFTNLQTT